MMLQLSVPVVIALIGATVYGLTEGKVSEIGRILFFSGALAALLHLRA